MKKGVILSLGLLTAIALAAIISLMIFSYCNSAYRALNTFISKAKLTHLGTSNIKTALDRQLDCQTLESEYSKIRACRLKNLSWLEDYTKYFHDTIRCPDDLSIESRFKSSKTCLAALVILSGQQTMLGNLKLNLLTAINSAKLLATGYIEIDKLTITNKLKIIAIGDIKILAIDGLVENLNLISVAGQISVPELYLNAIKKDINHSSELNQEIDLDSLKSIIFEY